MNIQHFNFRRIRQYAVLPALPCMCIGFLLQLPIAISEAAPTSSEGFETPYFTEILDSDSQNMNAHFSVGIRLMEQYVDANCIGLVRATQLERVMEISSLAATFRQKLNRDALRTRTRQLLVDSIIDGEYIETELIKQSLLDVQHFVSLLYKPMGNYTFDEIVVSAMTDRERVLFFALSAHWKKILHEECLSLIVENMTSSEALKLRNELKLMNVDFD